jgi:hypothetical protein
MSMRERIQQLLSDETSPLRDELLGLGFDALASVPLRELSSTAALAPLIYTALARETATLVAERHVLPGITRVTSGFDGADETLQHALSERGVAQLRAIIQSNRGPRFAWLAGAVDPVDVRNLIAPVIQQVLVQFASKLVLPVLGGGSDKGGANSTLGGLVGRIGKQVQKSAGQMAEVGKSVISISGIAFDFEKRMQSVARDFSQTASAEFRSALLARLQTPEGRALLERIRERVLERVLAVKLDEIARDLLRLPVPEIAALTVDTLDHLRAQPLFRELLEQQLSGVLEELEQRSLADLLAEAGLLAEARTLAASAVAPGIKALARNPAFGDWLDRLLTEAAK